MRALSVALLLPLAACSVGSNGEEAPAVTGTSTAGAEGERNYAVADFTSIEQRGPDDVDVRVGTGFSVRAEGDAEVLDTLRVSRVGDALRIERSKSGMLDWSSKGKAKVYVTMPRITEASLAGAGDMTIDRVEGAAFEGEIAGAGTLSVASLVVDAVELSLAGAGSVKAAGTTGSFKGSIAGAGDIEAPNLKATSADISVAGAGDVRANVEGKAKVSIMGAGNVDLGPKAQCDVSKMGAGSVRCGG